MVAGKQQTINREIRFMGFFRESPPLHFYVMQFVVFGYMLYRFLSRDYMVYGFLPHEMFNYARTFNMELWPTPPLHFTTFQFIYSFISRPSPELIGGMQWVICVACLFGLIGILPRWMAGISFALGVHLTGMMQSSHSEVDGGTLVLALLLLLTLSPSSSFYGPGKWSLTRRSVDCQWPLVMLFLIVGAFYSSAGLNKLIDVGPHWPFVLYLDRMAEQGLDDALFLTNGHSNPAILKLHFSPILNVIAGILTLIGELFYLTILFLPRYRLFFALTMTALHVLVLETNGINFVGSSCLLFLCLDLNIFARKIVVRAKPKDKWLARIKRYDIWNRIEVEEVSDAVAVQATDENGECYEGLDVYEQIAARSLPFLPFSLFLKVPGTIYLLRAMMRR